MVLTFSNSCYKCQEMLLSLVTLHDLGKFSALEFSVSRDAVLSGGLHSGDLEQIGPSTTSSYALRALRRKYSVVGCSRSVITEALDCHLSDGVVAAHLGWNDGHLYNSRRER